MKLFLDMQVGSFLSKTLFDTNYTVGFSLEESPTNSPDLKPLSESSPDDSYFEKLLYNFNSNKSF